MSFQLDWKGSNVIVTFQGIPDFEEILRANNLIVNDPRFDTMEFQVFDFSSVEKFSITERDAEILAVLDKTSAHWNRKINVALIGNIINPEVIRLAEKYMDVMSNSGWPVKLFANMGEARKWLSKEVPVKV